MVKKITVLRKYRPEISHKRTQRMPELVERMSRSTSLTEGAISLVVLELRDQILMACRAGEAAKVDGLGTFTPTMRLNGKIDILFRPDPYMLKDLNKKGAFIADIDNKKFKKKTAAQLVAHWNAEHPDDPVEDP